MAQTASARTYGPPLGAQALYRFLQSHVQNNVQAEERGEAPVPLCIWGEHGIGKTQIVEAFARENQMDFAYLAPAQYEEMGDLAGLPELENGKTVFRPASWVPRQKGPGILLIDDFNRADERILRGLMQLLQGYGLAGWQLPPHWQIVLTANPDRGDYSVTPLDEAMLTRMIHIELVFQTDDWLTWAQKAGIDPRAQKFMQLLLNDPQSPALPKGRTTARSLTQLFRAIEHLNDWKSEVEQIAIYAQATLEEETADAFLEFVRTEAWKLPQAREILATAFRQIPTRLPHPILLQHFEALARHLQHKPEQLSKKEKENLLAYLVDNDWPKDLYLLIMRRLQQLQKREINEILNKPEVVEKML